MVFCLVLIAVVSSGNALKCYTCLTTPCNTVTNGTTPVTDAPEGSQCFVAIPKISRKVLDTVDVKVSVTVRGTISKTITEAKAFFMDNNPYKDSEVYKMVTGAFKTAYATLKEKFTKSNADKTPSAFYWTCDTDYCNGNNFEELKKAVPATVDEKDTAPTSLGSVPASSGASALKPTTYVGLAFAAFTFAVARLFA